VSAATDMSRMFDRATGFHQVLCSAKWLSSTADKTDMFKGAGANSAICTGLPPPNPSPPPPLPPLPG